MDNFNNELNSRAKDLENVLDVLRYWMINKIPWKVYDFIRENKELNYDKLFEIFKKKKIFLLNYLQSLKNG